MMPPVTVVELPHAALVQTQSMPDNVPVTVVMAGA
jgi:hypothetical protein